MALGLCCVCGGGRRKEEREGVQTDEFVQLSFHLTIYTVNRDTYTGHAQRKNAQRDHIASKSGTTPGTRSRDRDIRG